MSEQAGNPDRYVCAAPGPTGCGECDECVAWAEEEGDRRREMGDVPLPEPLDPEPWDDGPSTAPPDYFTHTERDAAEYERRTR